MLAVNGAGPTLTTGTPYTLQIPAGTVRAILAVTPVNDNSMEGEETIVLTLRESDDYLFGDPAEYVLVLIDDDVAEGTSRAYFSAAPTTVAEGGMVMVGLIADATVLTVRVRLSGSAVFNTDYTSPFASSVDAPNEIDVPLSGGLGNLPLMTTQDRIDETDERIMVTLLTGTGYVPGTPAVHGITVLDDDELSVGFAAAGGATIVENAGTSANAVIDLGAMTTENLPVPLFFRGSASPSDYRLVVTGGTLSAGPGVDGVLTINSGVNRVTMAFTPIDDAAGEGDEIVSLVLGTDSGYTLGRTTWSFTIADDERRVIFDSASATVTEGGRVAVVVRVEGGGTLLGRLPVMVRLGGGATDGTDYRLGGDFQLGEGNPRVLSIPTLGTSRITIETLDNQIMDGLRELTLTLVTDSSGLYTVDTAGGRSAYTLSIEDNDTTTIPVIRFSNTSIDVDEGDGTVRLSVTVNPPPATPLSVPYTVSAGTATAVEDYQVSDGTLSINTSQTTAFISANIVDDLITEASMETFSVALTAASDGSYNLGSPSTQTVNIADNDFTGTPTISFESPVSAVTEGDSGAITVRITPVSGERLAIRYEVVSTSTATAGTDYTALANLLGVVENTAMVTITLATLTDDVQEASGETVALRLLPPLPGSATYDLGAQRTHIVTINDAALPVVGFSQASPEADENDGSVTVVINISPQASGILSVPVTIGGTAEAPADYSFTVASPATLSGTGADRTLTIPAENQQAVITVALVDDDALEGDEDVSFMLGPSVDGSYVLGTNPSRLTIRDNDVLSDVLRVSFDPTRDSASATEGEAVTPPELQLSAVAPAGGLTISYLVSGNATAGVDYTTLSGSVSIAAGSDTATIPITLTDDSTNEAVEMLELTLVAGTGYVPRAPLRFVLTINDDDEVAVSFADVVSVVNENGVITSIELQATPAPASPLSVQYMIDASGTATADIDYTPPAVATVTIGTGGTGDLRLQITDDAMDEMAETIIIVLQSNTGYTLGATDRHTVTINDNDVPQIRFNPASVSMSVMEDAGVAVTLTVTIDPTPFADLVIPLAITGEATDNTDYTLGGTNLARNSADDGYQLDVSIGSSTATLTVTPSDDEETEGAERVVLTMGDGTGSSGEFRLSLLTSTSTVTINDDETSVAPTVSFTAESATAAEGDGTVTADLQVVPPEGSASATVSAMVLSSGTAVRGTDYTLSVGGSSETANPFSVSVSSGTATSISIVLTDDTALETIEDIVLTLQPSADTYTLSSPLSHRLSITDDDVSVVDFSAAASSVSESALTTSIMLTVAPPPVSAFDVMLTGTAGTGLESGEYTLPSSVRVMPGEATVTLRVGLTDDVVDEGDEVLTVALGNGDGYTVGTTQSTHTLTITDDDVSEVAFALAGSTVAEDAAGALTVTVNVSPAPMADLTVPVTVSGSATVTADYTQSGLAGTSPNLTLTVASGNTTATFTVTPVQDILPEGTEPITFALGARTTGGDYMLGTLTEHTVLLTDDDTGDLPEVSFAAGAATAAENAGPVTATVMVDPAPAAGTTVDVMIRVSGSAARGTDYTLAVGGTPVATDAFTVQVGASGAADISITLVNDEALEAGEDMVLTLQPSTSVYTLTPPVEYRLSITDDDASTVAFQQAVSQISENELSADITVTVTPPSLTPLTLMLAGTAGTGLANSEYTLPTTLRIARGAATAILRVALGGSDEVDEDPETLTIELMNGTGYNVGGQSTHVLTITDATVPRVTFAAPSSVVGEGAGAAHTVTVNVSPTSLTPFTVPVTVSGTATVVTDYALGTTGLTGSHPSYMLTVPASAAAASFTVTPEQDTSAEGTETIIITLGAQPGVYELGVSGHTVELTDDDTGDLPEVSFTAGTATAAEGAGSATATVMVAPAPAAGESIDVMVAVSGTAVLGTDYTLASGAATTFTVSVDDTGMAAISIMLTDDSTPENTEDLVLTVQPSVSVYTLSSPLSHRLSITDNDVPAVNFSAATSTVAENALTASIMLTVAPPPASAFDVMVTGAAGAGLEVGEYTLPSSVRVMPGEATVTLRVALNDDAVDELAETLTVTLAAGTGYTVGTTQSTHTLTITDDDVPEVAFALAGSTVAEDAGGALTVTVNVSPAPMAELTVPVTVGGSATITTDYTQSGLAGTSPNLTLTVASGDTTATFTVTPVQDTAAEGTEPITFTLGERTTGGEYMLGTQTGHTVELTDDDTGDLPEVSFTAGTATAAEGAGSATATVMVAPAPAAGESIDVMVAVSGTAVLGTDYTLASGAATTFTVSVDDTGMAAISIMLTDDSTPENTEDLVLTVQPSLGVYTLLSPLSHRLSITDNDVPAVNFAMATSEEAEDALTASIMLTVAPPPVSEFDVMVTGVAGAGLEVGEYTLPSSVRVMPGEATVTLRVALNDDAVDELAETLTVTLAAGTGYTVGTTQSTHTLTITDDDVPEVAFALAGSTVAEDAGGALTVTVNVSPAPMAELTVPVTVGGSATITTDYTQSGLAGTSPNLTLTVASGDTTATFTVTPVQDTAAEGTEPITFTLGERTTGGVYILGTQTGHTVELTDDDTGDLPEVSFTAGTATAAEGAGSATATVMVAPAPAAGESIDVMVAVSGTAVLGTDYTLASGAATTFTVSVDDTGMAAISIMLTDDSTPENTEDLVLTVQPSLGVYTLLSPLSHRLSITDNDVPAVNFAMATSEEAEDALTASIMLTVAPPPVSEFDVMVTGVAGAGLEVGEYTLPSSVRVMPGEATVTLRVALNDDAVDELAETLTVTLAAGTGYTVGTTQSTHTLTITDDDVPEVAFALAGSTVAEDAAGALTVTVNVSPAPMAELTVPVTVGGSATITTDYTQSGLAGTSPNLTLTVASGDTTATFTVTPVQDTAAEGTEPITFTLGERTTGGEYILGTQTGHTVELTDDDTGDLPEVSFTAGTATAAEGAGSATATVMVAPAPAAGESIDVMVAVSGTAVLGTDYTLASGAATTFTVSVDDTGMAAISIMLTDDSTPENTEDLVLTVQPSLGVYTLLSPLSHRLSITDNDVPAVNFAMATSEEAEDALTASIMLTVAPPPVSEFDVMVTGVAGAGLEVGEYTLPSSVRVMPGEATVTLRVALNDDAVDELAETLTVTLAAGTGYTVGTTQSTHTLTITDDDVPEVAFALAGSTVAEDAGGALTVTVNVSPAPVAELTVPVTVGGSATINTDYTQSGLAGTTLTVSATTTTATFTVTPVQDTEVEGTEPITFTLGERTTGGDYMLGTQTGHTVELTDDDTGELPEVSFTAGTATAAESAGSATATVMVAPAPAAGREHRCDGGGVRDGCIGHRLHLSEWGSHYLHGVGR